MDVRVGYKESWELRIDAFELEYWSRFLRAPWNARRSKQSILMEISAGCSLEELMLKLKLPYLATWCEELINWKDPDAGKDWEQEEKGMTEDETLGWHHWLNGMGFSAFWEFVMDTEAWGAAVLGVTKKWTRLSDWTKLNRNGLEE